jgi:hypothetical protein
MMSDEVKWGWLRLALALVQMGLVVAALISYFRVGLDTTTLLLVISATIATLISRHLYEGRRSPPPQDSTRPGDTNSGKAPPR